jgi:hypothetical protein
MKYKTVILFTLIASASSVFADYIHLKNGTLLKGRVIKVTDSSIEYDPEGEIPFDTVNRTDVEKIVYDNGKSVILNSPARNAPAAPVSNTSVPEKTKETTSETVSGNASEIPGFHRHDGFFFRGYLGYGYTSSTVKSDYGDFKISGLNGSLGLQIGGAIVDNIIPFAELRSIATSNQATTKYGGKKYTYPDNKQSAGGVGLGIGLCVYIPETQFYLSGTYYNSHTAMYGGDFIDETTKSGKGFGLSAGYELWVSDNWGIGLAAFYYYGKASFDKNSYGNEKSRHYQFSDTTYQSFGIGLSCTYN